MMSIEDLFRKIATAPPASGKPEYIIAGLGNPGREYEEQQVRCRIMAVIALLCFSAGLAALFI